MPFPSFIFLIHTYTNYNNTMKFYGKEEEFDFSRKKQSSCNSEKASDSASNVKASITVEAVICIPLFFYAALCLIWLLEIRTIQTTIRCGLQSAGKELAESQIEYVILSPTNLEASIVSLIGAERLNRSIVVDGAQGIHCEKSYVIPGSGIYELKVEYRLKLPFPFFQSGLLAYEENMRMKGWNGYAKEQFHLNSDQRVVYITETGVVYHMDYHCNYLEPSVRRVDAAEIGNLRNENGEKYIKCPLCTGKNEGKQVYITDYGNRYHSSVGCSGLKRSIYAVPISEVKGRTVCSKCGK